MKHCNKSAYTWILGALLIVAMACACKPQTQPRELPYFDVKQFMDDQASGLTGLRPHLTKTFTIDGKDQIQEIPVNDSLWWDEFRIFKEHDINKPVLFDAYEITSGLTETGERYTLYTLKDGEQSGVTYMKITYIDTVKVNLWESYYREQNPLYSSERYVNMVLDSGRSGYQVAGYGIRGFHKLLWGDTVHYQMQAILEYRPEQ